MPAWFYKTNGNINQLRELLKSEFGQIQAIINELSKGKHEEQPTGEELKKEKMSSRCVESQNAGDAKQFGNTVCKVFQYFLIRKKFIVFNAPDRNKWLTSRQIELESLETCLPLELNSNDNFRMAAICGLCGFNSHVYISARKAVANGS